jgi:hypothetical protein
MVIYNKIYQKERKWVTNGARTGYPFGVSVITRGSCCSILRFLCSIMWHGAYSDVLWFQENIVSSVMLSQQILFLPEYTENCHQKMEHY